jgi:hypothetical protein
VKRRATFVFAIARRWLRTLDDWQLAAREEATARISIGGRRRIWPPNRRWRKGPHCLSGFMRARAASAGSGPTQVLRGEGVSGTGDRPIRNDLVRVRWGEQQFQSKAARGSRYMRRQSSNGALLTDASGSLRCACRKMLTLGSILTSGPGASDARSQRTGQRRCAVERKTLAVTKAGQRNRSHG